MAGHEPALVVASAARTTTGNSGAIGGMSATGPVLPDEGDQIAVLIDVTAASGTGPSMVPTIEWSMDNGATFAQGDPADAMTALTATGTKVKAFAMKSNCYRIVWTITGTTPSFTFSVRTYIFGSP